MSDASINISHLLDLIIVLHFFPLYVTLETEDAYTHHVILMWISFSLTFKVQYEYES